MNSLNNRGVHSENLRILPNCAPNKMDYRQKVVSKKILYHLSVLRPRVSDYFYTE